MSAWNLSSRNGAVVTSAFLLAAGLTTLNCGFSSDSTGTSGSSGQGSAGTGSNQGAAGDSQGSAGTGSNQGTAGTGSNQGTAGTGSNQGTAGTTGAAGVTGAAGTGSATGAAGTTVAPGTFKNYELTGTFPNAPAFVATKPGGQLKYTKFVVHSQFLGESCSIADYNDDGIPDVSSGRMWYAGTGVAATPINPTGHPFRSGHGVLPALGDGPELNTGVSDDWSDFPWDMNGDGKTDIINIAQCDVPESNAPTANPAGTPNKIGIVQVHATAVWYENPGAAAQAGDPMWTPHLMHSDVRLEQHGLVDMNGDGYPEIYGACKGCPPGTTKGYYQGDPKAPNSAWLFKSVTQQYTFPFSGSGWLHGEGAGDINKDGKPDLLERGGIWLQGAGGTWSTTVCAGPTSTGCWIKQELYQGGDNVGNVGASHMYGADMDKDGCTDVVAADWAHGERLYWYQHVKDAGGVCTLTFKKIQFMGSSSAADITKWGAGFTEPHALQVVDMDGDGRLDVVTGKMRYAHPRGYGDPDLEGRPYLYVFKNTATADARTGSPITLVPVKVDPLVETGAIGKPEGGMGVGRQLSVGHINTDGIPDICIASKIGLAVFLGQ